MSEPIPEKIIVNFNQGDSGAFRVLYESLYPDVDWLSRSFIRQADVSADITAKAFTQLWHYRGRFSNQHDIQSFLFTTVKNASLDHLRHQKVIRKNRDALLEQLPMQENPPDDQEKTEAQLLDLVYHAIEQLPKKCRLICRLAFIEGMEIEDIARKLGIAEKTVRNQKVIGLHRLRIRLGSNKWKNTC